MPGEINGSQEPNAPIIQDGWERKSVAEPNILQKAAQEDIERDSLLARINEAFSDRPAMRHTEIKTTVKKLLTVSDRTVERKIDRAVMLGTIKVNDAGPYTGST